MLNNKICKFFLKNECKHGDQCKFLHDKTICRNYFFDAKCKHQKCKFKHTITINKKNKPKNTENFNPNHLPSDINILVGNCNDETFYKKTFDNNDIILVPNFFENNNLYEKLLNEIKDSGIEEDKLWKLWHGDNHLIADDNINWKDKVPTYKLILEKIEKYLNIEIKNTRLNYYKNSSDWKPFHHDAAAVKEHIAELQNFTVGISFGATRDIAFENVKTKTTISIPLLNSTAYGFAKDVNVNWKHGIPQVHPDKAFEEGRISIIAWGKN